MIGDLDDVSFVEAELVGRVGVAVEPSLVALPADDVRGWEPAGGAPGLERPAPRRCVRVVLHQDIGARLEEELALFGTASGTAVDDRSDTPRLVAGRDVPRGELADADGQAAAPPAVAGLVLDDQYVARLEAQLVLAVALVVLERRHAPEPVPLVLPLDHGLRERVEKQERVVGADARHDEHAEKVQQVDDVDVEDAQVEVLRDGDRHQDLAHRDDRQHRRAHVRDERREHQHQRDAAKHHVEPQRGRHLRVVDVALQPQQPHRRRRRLPFLEYFRPDVVDEPRLELGLVRGQERERGAHNLRPRADGPKIRREERVADASLSHPGRDLFHFSQFRVRRESRARPVVGHARVARPGRAVSRRSRFVPVRGEAVVAPALVPKDGEDQILLDPLRIVEHGGPNGVPMQRFPQVHQRERVDAAAGRLLEAPPRRRPRGAIPRVGLCGLKRRVPLRRAIVRLCVGVHVQQHVDGLAQLAATDVDEGRDRQRRDQPHVEGDDLQGVRDDQIGGERLGAPVRRRRTPADQPKAPRAEEGHGADDCYDRREHPYNFRRRRAPTRGAIGPHSPFFLRALTENFLPTADCRGLASRCNLPLGLPRCNLSSLYT